MPAPRAAVALYVALAAHTLVLLVLALAPPTQQSRGSGQGLRIASPTLGAELHSRALGVEAPPRPEAAAAALRRVATRAVPESGIAAEEPRRSPPAPGDRETARGVPAGTSQAPEPVTADAGARGGGGRDGYFARLRAHLAGHRLALPPHLAAAQARVRFTVSADGAVDELELFESSGIAELDAEAMDLIRRAAPLPAPPGKRAARLIVPVMSEPPA